MNLFLITLGILMFLAGSFFATKEQPSWLDISLAGALLINGTEVLCGHFNHKKPVPATITVTILAYPAARAHA